MIERAVLSPRAPTDLDDIWAYTAKRWGNDQAESYIRRIGQSIAVVAMQPGIGRPCPEVRDGYDKFPAGSHVLFYRATEDGVDIVRILHERMDFRQHLVV
jgi:toxin ParE1/3/4